MRFRTRHSSCASGIMPVLSRPSSLNPRPSSSVERSKPHQKSNPQSLIPNLSFFTRAAVFFAAAMLLLTTSLPAASVYWSVPSGDWSTASNWGGTEPTLDNATYITNGGTASITSTDEKCFILHLGNADFETSSIDMTTGSLTATSEYIGDTGIGTFNQFGGNNQMHDITLGYQSGSNGIYNLGGTGLLYPSYQENIGFYGNGTFNQTGGTNAVAKYLRLGVYSGSTGTYYLSGTGYLMCRDSETIGNGGVGRFIQTGGTNSTKTIYFNSGTYDLQAGLLSATNENIGYSTIGIFTQSGGTHSTQALCLGYGSASSGTYTLSGSSLLTAKSEVIGDSGSGSFTQSGGINSISSTLFLGYYSGSSGDYALSGSGVLSSLYEYIGYSGSGVFVQSGGVNSVGGLAINSQSQYNLTGGTLTIVRGLANEGSLNCNDATVSLAVTSGALDLINNTISNTENASLYIAPGSLLMLAPGYDPRNHFASYVNEGTTYVAGSTLTLGTGQTLFTRGSFNDLLVCSGDIIAPTNSGITLNKGLILQGGGNIKLANGSLIADDAVSSIIDGSLFLANQYVGKSGVGLFTQSAGTNSVSSSLYLGYDSDSGGTYNFSGTSFLSAQNEYVGYSGTGTFNQTGGTNLIKYFNPSPYGELYLGYGLHSNGTYTLAGTSRLSAESEYIGYSGVGSFTQSGGTNSIAKNLYLGNNSGSTGTYTLSGDSVLTIASGGAIYVGYSGTGNFTQSGGSNSISKNFYLGYYSGSSGNYTLSDLASLSTKSEFIGYSGVGSLTQSGGTNSIAGNIYLGYISGSTGTYTLSGNSVLSITSGGAIYIGYSGTGNFTLSGGSNSISNGFYLGYYSGSSGNYSLGNLASLSAESEYIGYSGSGAFTQTGGSHVVGNILTLGETGTGSYNLSGAAYLSAASEIIGNYGTGVFNQSSGINTISIALMLGHYSGSTGTYTLSETGALFVTYEMIGFNGNGSFNQTGGSNSVMQLALGNYGGNGTYNLSGTGVLSASNEYLGADTTGAGTFTQTSGRNIVSGGLYLGNKHDTMGIYTLSGTGFLSATNEYIGKYDNDTFVESGTGIFNQSGGTNSISSVLYLGYISGSTGVYNLSDSGILSAQKEYIGASGIGIFNQSGGMNTATYLSISANGQYNLSGGTLNIAAEFSSQGTLDFANGFATMNASGPMILDFTRGRVLNTQSAALNVSAGSLLIVPAGFDPASAFGFYANAGMLHVTGTTMTVAPDQGFGGVGDINDLVVCTGNITATAGGSINLNKGLILFGSGNVDLGKGSLNVDDSISCMTGGLLAQANQYVGKSGTGSFTQLAGTNTPYSLYLGHDAGSTGTYVLNGISQITSGTVPLNYEYIGYSGTGTFNQAGGTNSARYLYLGYNSGSSGSYNLSAGRLSAIFEYIGYYHIGNYGTGTFTQTGGTNSITGNNAACLYLGGFGGSSDTYNLSGTGLLSASNENIGGMFYQTGGTNEISNAFYNGGYYALSGTSLMSATTEYVGYNTAGTLVQTGGTNAINSKLYLGYNSAGTYTLSGDGILTIASGGELRIGIDNGTGRFEWLSGNITTPTLTLGSKGTLAMGFDFDMASLLNKSLYHGTNSITLTSGTLEITNGATAAQSASSASIGTLIVGSRTGSGVYQLGSAGRVNAVYEYVGHSGTGTFALNSGTNFSNGLFLGYQSGSTGMYYLNGKGLLISAFETIGLSGTGTFTQTGGTNTISTFLHIGYQSGSTGIYNLSDTGLLSTEHLFVSVYGSGEFNQTGGTIIVKDNFLVGYSSGSSGTYILSGGLLSGNVEYIGKGYSMGTFNQTGGTNSVSTAMYLGYSSDANGTYNLEGGTLITKSISKGTGTAQFNFGGGTLQASGGFSTALDMTLTGTGGDAKIDTAGHDVTLSGVLSGAGGLEKHGEGTLILAGSNAYLGETAVFDGILQITGDFNGKGKISIADGAGVVFGTPYTPSPAPVPEPATLVLLAAVGAGVGFARWKV